MKNIYKEMISLRRHLHKNPELSHQEFETSNHLKKIITSWGLEIIEVQNTSFMTILDSKKPGKTIVLRSELDALPIQESTHNLKQNKKVVSEIDSVSHACGHDVHMSIMMGVLKYFISNEEILEGKIIFVFEEAEEIGGGADAIISALKPYKPDIIYANHVAAFLDIGTVSIKEGPIMAGNISYNITVKGQEGHSSRPDLTINPIVVASHIITQLQTAWNYELKVNELATLGISQFHAGVQNNIIPNTAEIGGTIRFFDKNVGEKAFKILQNIASKVADVHNATATVTSRPFMSPVVNHGSLTSFIQKAARNYTIVNETWFASEPFSRYQQIAPTHFTLLGIKNDNLGSGAGHHTEKFDVDERSIEIGIDITKDFVLNALHQ